jgi:hypothetical protein
MDAFISRYLAAVDRNLGDPVQAKRYPEADKLLDLWRIQVQVWEQLLSASGQESTIGRAEHALTIEDGVSFYPLPGNFRGFIGLERRQDGERNQVIDRLDSISMFDAGPGVEILDGQAGMMIRPEPDVDTAESDWVLVYQKGPIFLHYGQAAAVTAGTITFAASPTKGELINLDDYYAGSLVRVYSATTGMLQTRQITAYNATTRVATLQTNWGTTPTGTILYEICPVLPNPYDDLYALDAAIDKCPSIKAFDTMQALIARRRRLWAACHNYYADNVRDRMPRRSARLRSDEVDPYPEV